MSLPETSPYAAADDVHIVVFEARPRWAPELQRQFVGSDVRVRSCRSVADISALSDKARCSVLVLEFSADPLGCCRYLSDSAGAAESVVVIGSRSTSRLEWAIRNLGADAYVADCITGEELADMCRVRTGMTRENPLPGL